jgi:hypothetical protein
MEIFDSFLSGRLGLPILADSEGMENGPVPTDFSAIFVEQIDETKWTHRTPVPKQSGGPVRRTSRCRQERFGGSYGNQAIFHWPVTVTEAHGNPHLADLVATPEPAAIVLGGSALFLLLAKSLGGFWGFAVSIYY